MAQDALSGTEGRANSRHAWQEFILREFGASGIRVMGSFLKILEGRKTYLLAGGVLLAVVVLVFLGVVSPSNGVAIVTVAGFACTFRSAIQSHHVSEVALLTDIAAAGVAYRDHNQKALAAAGSAAIEDGTVLAQEVAKESKA